MKSLQLTDLKKHETLPNSYQVSLAYKGRKVDLILDNYAYSLQQLLETAKTYSLAFQIWIARRADTSPKRI